MAAHPVPRQLRRAIERLEGDPARAWTTDDIASASGVRPRTLQRLFRRFLGRTPMAFVGDLRINQARREVLRASSQASVTEIAQRCGFTHHGRFAAKYRKHYGESPSETLRRRLNTAVDSGSRPAPLDPRLDRPAIAVLPFDLVGPNSSHAAIITDEIIAAVVRKRCIAVRVPMNARYHVQGKLSSDSSGRLRISTLLLDKPSGRYLWADCWRDDANELLVFVEQVASRIASAVERTLREVEICRVKRKDHGPFNAWDLTMRALPHVLSVEAAAEGMALELLEEAIELAPEDPLPLALAAWCRGLRGGHNFCAASGHEKEAARRLAERAAQLNSGDALTETFIAAGYTLGHDLTRATIHVDRALAFDGGSAWAWGRRGWLKAYWGEYEEATECFQLARALAPDDRLSFLCSVGIGAGHFGATRYQDAVRWFERAISENPRAIWVNHVLAPAYKIRRSP